MQYGSCNVIYECNVMNSMLWIQCYEGNVGNEIIWMQYYESTVCKEIKWVLCQVR